MRNALNNTAANVAPVATIATPAVTLPAAVVATLAATAAAATPHAPANAGKYGANHKAIATATVQYALTTHAHGGVAVAANGGKGASGKVTCMGLVAVAAAAVAAKGLPVTGANIVTYMRAMPAVKAAWANTKAGAGYANGVPTKAWCSGYVTGAARKPACLLAAVTA